MKIQFKEKTKEENHLFPSRQVANAYRHRKLGSAQMP